MNNENRTSRKCPRSLYVNVSQVELSAYENVRGLTVFLTCFFLVGLLFSQEFFARVLAFQEKQSNQR